MNKNPTDISNLTLTASWVLILSLIMPNQIILLISKTSYEIHPFKFSTYSQIKTELLHFKVRSSGFTAHSKS